MKKGSVFTAIETGMQILTIYVYSLQNLKTIAGCQIVKGKGSAFDKMDRTEFKKDNKMGP